MAFDSSNVQVGDVVPNYTIPGYVALSYIVSVVGCITALELLHRRVRYNGRYNWFLLAGAATAMGGVAIWSMHFIGMSAIIMGNDEPDMQIMYSPSYTVGSLLLAIGVMGLAFLVLSWSGSVTPLQIVGGGVICGAAICGMHYLGQIGIINYTNVWDWRYILGSAIIAVTAATIALGIFFWQKAVWTNTLWKRVLCGFGLAGAVSLMHWTAILGCSYAWNGVSLSSGWNKSDAVWVCGALALACCAVLLAFAATWRYISMIYARKAKQVSVALAYWDSEGRIMLNTAGFLPTSRITRSYVQTSIKDHFDTDHPIFSWLFRVSRNWQIVSDTIPYMRQHLRSEHFDDSRSPSVDGKPFEKNQDYSLTFKELFCIASHDLACTLDCALKDVGVLYDKIVDTGSITIQPKSFTPAGTIKSTEDAKDLESQPHHGMTLGRGQLLFLVRRVNKHEAIRLQSNGFNFAPVDSVAASLAHSMQISSGELKPYLDDLSVYHEMPRGMTPGVHLTPFILKPRIGGFEVLVRKEIRNLLPSVKLSQKKLDRWQIAFLSAYDDWDVHSLLTHWESDSTLHKFPPDQKEFVLEMCRGMRQLLKRVGDKLFLRARLIAKTLEGPIRTDINTRVPKALDSPSRTISSAGQPQKVTVIAFRFMTDIHYLHPLVYQDMFLSTRLFLAQQHCYTNSSDHLVFASHVHQELASTFGGTELPAPKVASGDGGRGVASMDSNRVSTFLNRMRSHRLTPIDTSGKGFRLHDKESGPFSSPTPGSSSPSPTLRQGGAGDNVSEKNLVSNAAENPFGGVHVSNEIEISVSDAVSRSQNGSPTSTNPRDAGHGPAIEMTDLVPMGLRTEIGVGRVVEKESMMDILMGITLGKVAGGEDAMAKRTEWRG